LSFVLLYYIATGDSSPSAINNEASSLASQS